MYGIEQLADPRLRDHTPVGRLRIRAPRLRAAAAALAGARASRRSSPPRRTSRATSAGDCRSTSPRSGSRSPSRSRCRGSPGTGRLIAPPPQGPFWSGYGRFLAHLGFVAPGLGGTIRSTLPFSLALVGFATLIAFVIGSAVGLIAAWRRGSAFDGTVTTTTAIVWTIPAFALAGVALELFGVRWHVFPIQWAYGLDVIALVELGVRRQRDPSRRAAAARPRRREPRSVGAEHAHGDARRLERRLRHVRARERALGAADHAALCGSKRAPADAHRLRRRVRIRDRRRPGARRGLQLLGRRLGAPAGGDHRQSAARPGARRRDRVSPSSS